MDSFLAILTHLGQLDPLHQYFYFPTNQNEYKTDPIRTPVNDAFRGDAIRMLRLWLVLTGTTCLHFISETFANLFIGLRYSNLLE